MGEVAGAATCFTATRNLQLHCILLSDFPKSEAYLPGMRHIVLLRIFFFQITSQSSFLMTTKPHLGT